MGVELPIYALPIPGGHALAAPALTLQTLTGAARILAERPQSSSVALLVPDGAAAGALSPAARDVLRRAATAVALREAQAGPGVRLLRTAWHRVLVAAGVLLLLDPGGLFQVLAGFWLALVYPLLHARAHYEFKVRSVQAADALAAALDDAPVEARSHAGLTALAHHAATIADDPAGAYDRLAAAARDLGLESIAALYAAAARGETASSAWSPVLTGGPAPDQTETTAPGTADAPPIEPAPPPPSEDEPRTSSTLSLTQGA